jgi:hypothetical protein
MSMASFLLLEYDDEHGEWLQVVTDNLDNRHEVLLLPREKHTIGSIIHLFNILGMDGEVEPCSIYGTHLDTSVWRVDYDPDGMDINAYRLTVR